MSNTTGGWSKGIVKWHEDGHWCLSVPFTWLLPEAAQFAAYHEGTVVGGPAVRLMPEWIGQYAQVDLGDREGVLQLHNPQATRTSLGCRNACPFCGVRRIEGEYRELAHWKTNPIVIDSNILQATDVHFDRVMDRLEGVSAVDFNQGLDATLFPGQRAERILSLKLRQLRFSWDSADEEWAVMDAVRYGLTAGMGRMERAHGHDWPLRLKDDFFTRLETDAAKLAASGFKSRVHLSFLGDVYAAGLEATTRRTLKILRAHGLNWQVLTKRPSAAAEDLDLYGPGCWLGTTLTGREAEEGGDSYLDRHLVMSIVAHKHINTWISAEPLLTYEALQEQLCLLWPVDFVAVGVEKGRVWSREDAGFVRLLLSREMPNAWGKYLLGWLLKESLRVPGLESPYSGNLVECGWEVAP